MKTLFSASALNRFGLLWLVFMAVTCSVFGRGVVTQPQA
jgi:hypothetical protein